MNPTKIKISGDGFLSETGATEARSLHTQIEPLISCVAEIVSRNRAALGRLQSADQQTSEGQQQVFSGIVLARILEVSEALIQLAKGGFGNEVNTLFRSFLEAYFLFGNVTNVPGFVPRYLQSDKSTRMKLMNAAEKRDEDLFERLREYATPEVRADLQKEIQASGATAISTFEMAAAIDCEAIYDSMYRICSATAHSSPRSLEPYVTENESGQVVEITTAPSLGKAPRRLYDLGRFLLKVYSGFNELHQADVAIELKLLQEKLDAFVAPD